MIVDILSPCNLSNNVNLKLDNSEVRRLYLIQILKFCYILNNLHLRTNLPHFYYDIVRDKISTNGILEIAIVERI